MTTGEQITTQIKQGFNLNTIAILISFLGIFGTIVSVWSGIQFRQTQSEDWHKAHEQLHSRLDAQRATTIAQYNTRLDAVETEIEGLDQILYRLGQVEGAVNSGVARVDRVVENYNSRFSDIAAQLNNISTEIALIKAAASRLEERYDNRRTRMINPETMRNSGDPAKAQEVE